MNGTSNQLYQAYGLVINSEIPLDGLRPGRGRPQVRIEFGRVGPLTGSGDPDLMHVQEASEGLGVAIDQMANFLVIDGRRVVVEPLGRLQPVEVGLVLKTVILSLLLYQRGQLLLHGSAVRIRDRAVLILGGSGAGKSTLAGALYQAGYPLLTDDLSAIGFSADGTARVLPGFPAVKIWRDSVRGLNRDPDRLESIFSRTEKRNLPVEAGFDPEPLEPDSIFILKTGPGPEVKVTPLRGAAKFQALIDQAYRPDFIRQLQLQERIFTGLARLAPQVPVYSLLRTADLGRLADLVAAVLETRAG